MVRDFCPYLEITEGESPPRAVRASAAATHTSEDYVLNANAKEFYSENHVAMPKTEVDMAEGKPKRGEGNPMG